MFLFCAKIEELFRKLLDRLSNLLVCILSVEQARLLVRGFRKLDYYAISFNKMSELNELITSGTLT